MPYSLLRRAVVAALNAENERRSVNILLCSRREIRRLNREFRGVDRVTDVLSFPPEDIAVCIDKIKRQAKRYGHSVEREAVYLTVHSVLHLLGYDHETPDDERVMLARADVIMGMSGL